MAKNIKIRTRKSKITGPLKIRIPHGADKQRAFIVTGFGDKTTLTVESGVLSTLGVLTGAPLYKLGTSLVRRLSAATFVTGKPAKRSKSKDGAPSAKRPRTRQRAKKASALTIRGTDTPPE